MNITEEKYVVLTTFRRVGTPVSTAVWIVALDAPNTAGFWTSSGSGKAKRIAHTPRVTVQASDSRGRTKDGSPVVEAMAELVSSGPVFDEVHRKIVSKYGFMTKVTKLLQQIVGFVKRKRIPYGDRCVVITLPVDA